MKYVLLKELIEMVETYKEDHTSDRMEDFTIWLNNKLFSIDGNKKHSAHDELLIAFKVMYLNKELKKQTKKALAVSSVYSIDEYSFLLHLAHQDSFRKMELIELHNLKAPTGIEIIKRLLRSKLIEEFDDEEDRRAKRIKITRKGVKELNEIKPKIDAIFTKFSEPLKLDEKIHISALLDKLIRKK